MRYQDVRPGMKVIRTGEGSAPIGTVATIVGRHSTIHEFFQVKNVQCADYGSNIWDAIWFKPYAPIGEEV